MPEKLTIISNESISTDKGIFCCDNIELKSIPEGLSKNYEVLNIGRKSKVKRSFKINLIRTIDLLLNQSVDKQIIDKVILQTYSCL